MPVDSECTVVILWVKEGNSTASQKCRGEINQLPVFQRGRDVCSASKLEWKRRETEKRRSERKK
jgi:hypothetical protein